MPATQSVRCGRLLATRTERLNRTNAHILQLTRTTCRAELVLMIQRPCCQRYRDVQTLREALHSLLPSQSTRQSQTASCCTTQHMCTVSNNSAVYTYISLMFSLCCQPRSTRSGPVIMPRTTARSRQDGSTSATCRTMDGNSRRTCSRPPDATETAS